MQRAGSANDGKEAEEESAVPAEENAEEPVKATRIVCGENETTRFGFKTLIEYGKVAFVQPDISRCGGFTEAKKIAALAELHSINVVPHCWSSGIVEAAALHLIASVPNANLLEYDVYPPRSDLTLYQTILR